MTGLPGPMWPAGTPSASELPLPAANGKHPSLRCSLHGTVASAAAQSKRLLFFSVDAEGQSGVQWRCIAKMADGFLSAAQVAELTVRLQPGATVCLLTYPELLPADAIFGAHCGRQIWLHVVSYLLCNAREAPPAAPEPDSPASPHIPSRRDTPLSPDTHATSPEGRPSPNTPPGPYTHLSPDPDSAAETPRLSRRTRREAGEAPSRVLVPRPALPDTPISPDPDSAAAPSRLSCRAHTAPLPHTPLSPPLDPAAAPSRLGRRARWEVGEAPSRVRPNNGARHQVFVSWLVATFGQERLQRGGVLDIAGGAGCTAFELSFRRSIA
jgi:hypothetical protein